MAAPMTTPADPVGLHADMAAAYDDECGAR